MLNVTARQDLMNKIVETLNVVVEDARFEFKEDKMQATVVDASLHLTPGNWKKQILHWNCEKSRN